MVLHYLFVGFFVVAFLMALGQLCISGSFDLFNTIVQASFDQSKNGFEISLYLTGVLCFWLGVLRVAERSGAIERLAHYASPLLNTLFPDIPKGHPVMGSILMNISANMLGLDNAATPIGLKAMAGLQEINPNPKEPTKPMLMFLALNASGLTLIPTSIIAYRMQAGAANPADVFLPILIATSASTIVAMVLVALRQRINLFARPLLLSLSFILVLIGGIIYASQTMPAEIFRSWSTGVSSFVLLTIILGFFLMGCKAKINVYDAFIEGAKEGFSTAIAIIPYLIAMLVGIGVFRASGAMNLLIDGVSWFFTFLGVDTDFVGALPTMLMKPLSGSGARGMMVDAMQTYGADSFLGRLTSTVQGASDTTLYVLALYLGSVGIRRTSYALDYSLLADLAGMITAVLVTYLFFT